uniref:Uncharacterized protein n=1 Tax=Hemiselmis andersenii TaxID=464988 RepID=A0A6T8NBT7_HEMAN|mmetsp:Transcript_22683/g.52676  ORF Transcript_22683/g.52676 Transcript_22683/m.52676 type:complete len:222 (+) Transcript_22683:114-779(+)|eukprot:CAMPEP_0114142240 /NCGR_PEP_ID=MMETSP0043_2-20121206/18344_1 /TAXON_ID=464988 /ORGANISM="Hemiselmis andersenii, Strain CCMP644" /LENGTH=221 /DNA_ID=CAMNT_0001236451 /DNA_START=66 /DNA_END=731 /DNA_ORIENTATION=+
MRAAFCVLVSASCLSLCSSWVGPDVANGARACLRQGAASRPTRGRPRGAVWMCEQQPVAVKDEADEFAALGLPMEPLVDLSPDDVILALNRGLRFNDVPNNNSGLERCFNFANSMCRAAVGGDGGKTGSHVVSLEQFIKYADNPTFGSMCNNQGFEREKVNIIPGTPTRGALATQVVSVTTQKGDVRRFLWTLQQERLPPQQGMWLVKQCLYMKNAFEETL